MGTALITGASVGIGYELAKLFARDGHDLVLVARDRARLEAVASELSAVKVRVVVKDLAELASPGEIHDELERSGAAVDFLVNNAGFGSLGALAESDLPTQMRMIQVNIGAPTALMRLFLPGMIERGGGRILNVASTAAFVPGPYMSVYYASKAYVLSHSVAVAREVKGSGVTVTALCPGPTRTEFQKRAGMEEARLFRAGVMNAASVARAGYEGMMRGKLIVIPGLLNRLSALASRILPRGALAGVTARLNRGH